MDGFANYRTTSIGLSSSSMRKVLVPVSADQIQGENFQKHWPGFKPPRKASQTMNCFSFRLTHDSLIRLGWGACFCPNSEFSLHFGEWDISAPVHNLD